MSLFGGEKKVKRYIYDLISGKKTMAQVTEPLTPFEKDLLSGICRHWICLNHMVDQYLQKPTQHRDFRLILIIGFYRLFLTSEPNNKPVIDGVMLLSEKWGLGYRKKVIYAILNNALRKPQNIEEYPDNIKYSLPDFFHKTMRQALGHCFDLSAQSQIQRPKIWGFLFDKNNLSDEMTAPLAEFPQAIQFKSIKNLAEKQGYAEGYWHIQDLAMQKMASFLPEKIEGTLIDACSAPGGKTIMLSQKYPENTITAIELESKKIQRLKDNLARCHGKNVNVMCINFLKYIEDINPSFIWVDAPCSGSGVIGKHPEIKYQVNASSLESHQELQKKLLAHAWKLLKPGGTIFYSTCSIFSQENDDIVESMAPFVSEITPCTGAIKTKYGITFLMENQFGGYLSVLQKPVK